MSKRMLIDASHPEETRVVVLDGRNVEEFDFESASRRPLKGNIYLAKVTRVEPSLQAAFVEYGGNRQGFLAFSEIHPDYYQIPMADRQALIEEQSRRLKEEDDDGLDPLPTETSSQALMSGHGEAAAASLEASAGAGDSDNLSPEDGAIEDNLPPDEPAHADDEHAGHVHEEDGHRDHEGHEDRAAHDHGDDGHNEQALSEHEDPAHGDEIVHVHAGSAAPEEDEEDEEDEDDEDDDGPEQPPELDHDHETDAEDNDEGEQEHQALTLDASEDAASAEHAENGEAQPETSEPAAVAAEATGVPQPAQRRSRRDERPRRARRRQYKIQEVIKRRQIILVQVVKEERGNKGASLTTYLSLAGRYCVLMPNTPRGGGISRKITSPTDRRRLKTAAQSLDVPEGMGLIVRTAGANRTKVEIKRDYEYLLRLWDSVRELTLRSNAPACVYEEGNIIKRAIRDLYNKDISEVVVEGPAGYRDAKEFMRMLMPSHAKNVKPHVESMTLFQHHHVEAQLDAMFSPTVTLRSGGYIVINQTEALVSIDVNSGKATREHNIEDTAFKTNLEAADEIARQLRLRDLAGLIVIDFIDMEDGKNDRHVEKRLRDAVRHDRARIQIGKISQFGLLEMSRQRLRAGVVAGSTVPCPHCGGQGIVRSTESAALRLLRALDEEGQRAGSANIDVKAPEDVIIYTLNQKRREIARIEDVYNLGIVFAPETGMMGGSFTITRTGARAPAAKPATAISVDAGLAAYHYDVEDENIVDEAEVEEEELNENDVTLAEAPGDMAQEVEHTAGEANGEPRGAQAEGQGGHRKRRRRRGGRGRGERNRDANRSNQRDLAPRDDAQPAPRDNAHEDGDEGPEEAIEFGSEMESADGQQDQAGQGQGPGGQDQGQDGRGRRRRRRRRGGRGRRGDRTQSGEQTSVAAQGDTAWRDNTVTPNAPSEPQWTLAAEPSRTPEPREEKREETPAPQSEAPTGPARKGWWSRTLGR